MHVMISMNMLIWKLSIVNSEIIRLMIFDFIDTI